MVNMQGKIIKQISNDYTVLIGEKKVVCKARGKFRNMDITPLVGDNVVIDIDNRYIKEILPRRNVLIRPMVANIDQALIVTSVHIPDFSSYLLDKLILQAEYNNVEPIICFTKLDLISNEKRNDIRKIEEYYRKIGYKVFENTDLSLKDIFKDKITVLAGQSGAGKSTLLNNLDCNLNLETNEVSVALGRGKHTTRHTELLSVLGGLIADTPGFSKLDNPIDKEQIKFCFKEFSLYDKCLYRDCMHDKEDDCCVKSNVKKGNILNSRYDNYIKFIRGD
mgnify:CR=1 FL=1